MNKKKSFNRNAAKYARDKASENTHCDQDNDNEISKSAVKRQMLHLQALGETLVKLNDNQREQLPLSQKLSEALKETKNIKKHEARRRHFQFIGKLMRDEDDDTIKHIESFLSQLKQQHQKKTQQHHEIEQWREDILGSGNNAIDRFMQAFPESDRQWLRQIQRQHAREQTLKKPPTASRKLFEYLRGIIQHSPI